MPERKQDLGGTFKGSRNESLDGIRGLAALSVALGHCYLVAFGLDIWRATARDLFTLLPEDIGYRLLSLAFPADPAVMVFFVLSGNVLWQSFVRKRLSCGSFLDYVLSRLWRLMPPIAAATVLMDYFTRVSGTEPLANILLLRTNVLGVTWSLQVEMVGSLAIFAMWLWGRGSLPKMMAAVGWQSPWCCLCVGRCWSICPLSRSAD
jgi:peptidoglycan/LPS O-acetylase OafA/YrhL